MRAIEILASSGYPDGRTERRFAPGERPVDLAEDYAALLVAKGLARDLAGEAAASASGQGRDVAIGKVVA